MTPLAEAPLAGAFPGMYAIAEDTAGMQSTNNKKDATKL
jgi:hypothetical protein